VTATAPIQVLLVDDDEDQRVLVEDMLRAGGTAVSLDWAPTGELAMEALQATSYDVALVDYHLGTTSGIDLMRAARTAGLDLPFIMLTGHTSRAVDMAAMSAGADDFLDKGTLTPELLERAIRYALRAARDRRELRQREERFRALIQHASDAILLLDPEGDITFASDSFERVTGHPVAGVVGRSAFMHVHPEDTGDLQAQFRASLERAGEKVLTEFRAQHGTGPGATVR
jgi:two-component system, cell cycle sensor histidine kinase and response regulator CckA